MRAMAAVLASAVSLMVAPPAQAETDADWAWPGMRYDVLTGHSWHSCSVGFPAWNSSGARYFLSAGHCFRSESGSHYERPGGAGVEIYSPSDHVIPVGFERTYTIPGSGTYDDVSLVEMYPGRKLAGIGWQHIPDNPVSGAVGDQACLLGFRHDTSNCGTVTGVDVHQTVTGYPWTEDVSTASYCAHPGDSGGAIYNGSGALGIGVTAVTAQNESRTPGPCSSSFIPILRVLDIFRHDDPMLTT
jgi:hypothetical protein